MVKRQVQVESASVPESKNLLPLPAKEPEGSESGSSSETNDPPSAGCSLPRICWLYLPCILAVLIGIVTVALLTVNAWAGTAISTAISHILGVPATVGSVDIALFSARSDIKDLRISSPPSYSTDFLTLQTGVIDLRIWSLLQNPVEIQEISLRNLVLSIDQRIDGDSNVKGLIGHANLIEHPKNPGARLVHTMTQKIIVDKISLINISTRVCIHPLCDAIKPGLFTAQKVQVSNLGRNTGGVYLYELVGAVVHALLVATIRASPVDISGQLSGALGKEFSHALGKIDYGQVQYDIGEGLKTAAQFTDQEFGMLGDGTKQLGNQAAGGVEYAGHQASKSIDQAFGLQNPSTPFGASVKTLIDSESNVLTDAVAGVVKNTSDVFSDDVGDIGKNVSAAVSGLSPVLGSMLQGLGGRLLRGHPA